MPAMRALLLWTLFLALLAPALTARSAQDATLPVLAVWERGAGRIEVGPRMGVLVDPSGSLTLEQVRADGPSWQAINRQSPNFGFTKDAYWFRFQLQNLDSQRLSRLIELPIPFLDHVWLYHYAGDTLQTQYRLGDEQPFAQRPVRHRNFVMPVDLSPGMNTVYLRLASSGTIEGPLRVWDPALFHAAANDESLLQGGVIGILLIMVVYNLFVYFSTRDINYLYYIGFVASYMLFHLTLTGYTFAYVWPNALHWNSFAISTFIGASGFFACLFTSHFLKLSSFSKPALYLVRVLTLLSFAIFCLSFVLPYSWTIRAGASITIPLATTALTLGYWRWWRGAKFARFYCLAWTAIFIGLAVLNASKLGWIPINLWTENASQIGIVLLVVLLSFTLADRINTDRSLRLNAQAAALGHERKARASQQALIEAKERANLELEARVQSRTTDLHTTLDQLKAANDRLLLLSTTDGLTKISNRAYFDKAVENELRRAERQQTAISLILFDIDHFKQINDRYGHLTGDACLRALADLMRPRIHRAGDVLARYGGEEFVIVLTGVGLTQSLAMAEEFRLAIESLRVVSDGHTVAFTASFGVVSLVPHAKLQIADLLAAADRALYDAKHDGRNCVRAAPTGT
jgi:diguanylate cyclase (GGDEF)-like protein